MTVGTNKLHFFYDNASRPAMVKYNGVLYTYVHNLQGDIVGIVDASGNLVVEYKYDAWGKPLSVSGSMATTLGTVNSTGQYVFAFDFSENTIRTVKIPDDAAMIQDNKTGKPLIVYTTNNGYFYYDDIFSCALTIHQF